MLITPKRLRWGLLLFGALIIILIFGSHRPEFSDDQQMGSRALAILFIGFVCFILGAGWAYFKKHPVRLLALLLGTYWLLFVYHIGLRFSPDSGYYLNYALNMHYAGNFYVNPIWPPLYPLLINAFMLFNGFPGEAASLLGGFMMIGILTTFTLILEEFSSENVFNGLWLIVLFIFPGFIFIHTIALSEVPFSFFILLSLLFVVRHSRAGKIRDYLGASISVACIVLTRYSGVAFVGAFFVYTVFYLYRNSTIAGRQKSEIIRYLSLNAISYIPVMIYGLLNLGYFLVRLSSSRESNYEITLFRPISAILESISADLGLYLGLLFVSGLALFLGLLRMNKDHLKVHSLITASYILTSFSFYIVFLVVIASRVNIFPIDTRYFSPIYPSLFVFLVIVFQSLRFKALDEKGQLFLDWGFQTVLLLALFSLIGNYALKMGDIVSKQYADRAYHSEEGFNLTPSSIQLSQYIDEKLTESGALLVTETEYYPGANGSGQLQPALFYREFTVANFPHQNVQFEDVNGFDFSIGFDKEGRSIHYRQVDIGSLETLVASIKQVLMDEANDAILLFVVEDDVRLDEAFMQVNDTGLRIIEDRFIDPYRIYQVDSLPAD